MANKAFQRTPNTLRPFAHACGILAQTTAEYSVPLNQALCLNMKKSGYHQTIDRILKPKLVEPGFVEVELNKTGKTGYRPHFKPIEK